MAYGIVFDGTKSVPVNANTNAKPTDFATKFVVAFDVVPVISDAGGTAVIYKNGGLFKTFPVTKTSTSVAVVGKTLEITHGITSFTQGEVYSVAITDGSVTGLGVLASGTYVFTIGDYVAPQLLTTAASFTPNKGAVDVMGTLNGSSFSLVIPFNEAVTKPAVPGARAVYIYKEDGTVVDIIKVSTLTGAQGLGTATITVPVASTAIFQENTNYYVSVDAGAFVDVSPNANNYDGLSAKTTWTFTTRDNSAPVISAKSVTAITDVTATLNVTLSEKGKYYYGVYPSAATPSVSDIIAGTGAVVFGNKAVAAGATNVTASLTGLTGGGSYKVYVVTENSVTVGAPVVATASENIAFTTIDNTPSVAIARGTLIDASKKTNALYMVFDEQVQGSGSGTLDLRKNSDESYVKQVAASAITSRKITAAEVTANTYGVGRTTSQWVVLVDLGMSLPSKVDYYVVFPAGYIKDMSGNAFAGAGAFIIPINKVDWAFTSSDFELPTVAVTLATPASLTSDINVTFNETVQKQLATTTDWAQVLALELNNVPVPFTVTSPAGAANGTVIVIHPTSAFTSNTTYTVRLRPDAVKDLSGNAIVTETLYNVTTGDLDALTVSYGSSLGATTVTNLVANSTLKIKFNKAVKVNTTGTTWVAADATNLLPLTTFFKGVTAKTFTLAYDAATYTATITPTDALVCNASDYVLNFDGSKIKDVVGTLLAPAAITYTVKDYNAPVVTTSHSGDMASGLPLTITLSDDNLALLTDLSGGALNSSLVTFKENSSNGANLGFGFAYNAGTGVITLTPTVALATGNTYYYGIGASVKDAAGNVTAGKYSTFKIVTPVAPPTIIANTYTLNGSAQTPVATKLVNVVPKTGNIITVSVTFNDNVKETQSVPAYNTVSLTDGVGIWTANVTPANVSGNTLTVDFAVGGPLASEAVCTLTLPAGIVQGSTAYTNVAPFFAPFAGKTISFDSKDIVAPVATANTPAIGATGVAVNTVLKLDFSEYVDLGAGNILIKEGATVVQTIPINSANVVFNAGHTQATIAKTENLAKYNTTYQVVVPAAGFKDQLSANPLAADYTAWNFTTEVNPQPSVTTLLPADNADLVPTTSSISVTFSEKVYKNYTPGQVTLKAVYLVEKKDGNGVLTGPNFAFNADPLNLGANDDVLVASMYIDAAGVDISDNTVTLNFGVSLAANKDYYILIAPESFKDGSAGTGTLANPIPGVYSGIVSYGAWNFTTKDVFAPTVTYTYTKRPDNKVSKTSDITITFSKPIEKVDGSAINNSDVANLFTLKKTAGPGFIGPKAFIGSINADKTVVTVLNSSLVTLGEYTDLSNYTIEINAASIRGKVNNVVLGANINAFTTSDYTAPVVTPSIVTPVSDIAYNAVTMQHEATVLFTCTDNMNLATVYYTIQEGDNSTAAPANAAVKADKMKAIAGASPQTTTYKFTSLKEKTSYVVWAVAVDEAGNESTVGKVVFVTDDITKPKLVTKPTSFDAAGQLTFVFDEAVSPVASSVRILDASSMKELATLNLLANPALPLNPNSLITSVFAPATSDALVNYYVEIDKGLVGDVPAIAGNAINYFDGLFRTDLMVTSKDVTAPVLTAPAAGFALTGVNVNYSLALTFSEPVQKVSTIPADAFVVEKWNGAAYEAFEVIDPANVVTNGTNTVTVNVLRALASSTTYRITINKASFKDLAGNVHAAGTLQGTVTTKDVLAPTVVFAPAKNATGVATATATLTMTFNEAIRLLDNTAIDSYDLDSLVYFKKGTTPMAFKAAIDGAAKVITITPTAALVSDANYTYGFKAKFEDASDNMAPADAATFATVVTSPAAQYLSWLPVKPVAPATSTWLGTSSPVTLSFTAPAFTSNVSYPKNNLALTPAILADFAGYGIITVLKNGVPMAAADLVFTTPDNKTITVAPKTNWGSSSIIDVIVNGGTLQIGETNTTVLGTIGVVFDANKYNAQDVVAPKVDATYAAAGFTAGYYPALVGVAVPSTSSPVIAKTEKLKLHFDEDVQAGTGTVEIHTWDGVLAKPAMQVTVDATDKKLVTLGDLTGLPTNQEYYAIVNPGIVKDLDANAPNNYAGLTDVKTWRFILKDDAIPTIASYNPVSSNIPVTTDLTINFDRPVNLGTGYVALYKSVAGGDAVQLWRGVDNGTTGAFVLSSSKMSATVNLNDLEVKTTYYVEVAGGTFVSAADGTKLQSALNRGTWSFTTESNDAPMIVATDGLFPAKDAVGVPIASDLQMTFNMPISVIPGYDALPQNDQRISIHAADGSYVYNTKAADLVVADNVLSVVLPSLVENKQYYVIVPSNVIRNNTYTPEYYGGVIVPYEWKFNTKVDATPATVTATSTTAPGILNIALKFSELVKHVSDTTVTVTGTGVKIKSITKSTADPKIYNVVLEGADLTPVVLSLSDGITDMSDNNFVAKTLNFTFGDYTGPTVVVTPPASPVPTVFTVGLKFNEPVSGLVFGGTAVIVTGGKLEDIKKVGDSYNVIVSAKEQTKVTIELTDAIQDFAPSLNKFKGDTLTYTTGDFTAPELLSSTPFEIQTADNHPTFTMTFSEDVKLGAGNLNVYKVNTTTPVLSIPLTAAMINGKVVTVTYAVTQSGLDKNARYYVLVDGAAIKDNAGNAFAGVTDVAAWTFRTGNFLTGTDPLVNGSLKVYPNPFVDVVHFDTSSTLSKVIVTNIAGQVVKEVVNPTNSIQLNELRSGVYFITLIDVDNVSNTAKIVKR